MARKKNEQEKLEETTSAEEILEQYEGDQPEAQDEGENLETVEEIEEEEA